MNYNLFKVTWFCARNIR